VLIQIPHFFRSIILYQEGIKGIKLADENFEEKRKKLVSELHEEQTRLKVLQEEANEIFLKAFGERVKELLGKNYYTIEEFSAISKIPQEELKTVLAGENAEKQTFTILEKICLGLNISYRDFFASEIFEEVYESEFFKSTKETE